MSDTIPNEFPFPRVPQIDNKSPAQIRKMGLCPPFHGRCRCDMQFLWGEVTVEVPEAPKMKRFKLAKTLKEAEQIALDLKLAKEVKYGGCGLGIANETNKTIFSLYNKYRSDKFKFERIMSIAERDETFSALAIRGKTLLLTPSHLKSLSAFADYAKYNMTGMFDVSYAGALTHEYGHPMMTIGRKLTGKFKDPKFKKTILGLMKKNKKALVEQLGSYGAEGYAEFFPEIFVAFDGGKVFTGSLKWIEDKIRPIYEAVVKEA